MNIGLHKKVTQSLKLIESLYTGSKILAFSGGKDSVVIYDLVKRAVGDVVPCIHAVTTRDPAGTLSFIRQNYPDDMEVLKERMDGYYLYDDTDKVYQQEVAGKNYVIIE